MNMSLELPDLSGLSRLEGGTALVTGGTGGIGLSTAVGLSRLGATVVITGRDPGRGAEAARRIVATTGNAEVRFVAADLSTVAGVEELARNLLEQDRPLQLLVNNAGALPPAGTRNADGANLALAVNHWAPFLLIARLLPLLLPAGDGPARIVNLTSGAIRLTRARPTALETSPGTGAQLDRSAFAAYAQSKCAALVAGAEWAERLAAVGGPVLHAADPGGADTALTRGMGPSNAVARRLLAVVGPGRRSAVTAARSTLVAAAAAELGSVTGRLVSARGRSRPVPTRLRDPRVRQQVWSLTCRQLGLDPDLPGGPAAPAG